MSTGARVWPMPRSASTAGGVRTTRSDRRRDWLGSRRLHYAKRLVAKRSTVTLVTLNRSATQNGGTSGGHSRAPGRIGGAPACIYEGSVRASWQVMGTKWGTKLIYSKHNILIINHLARINGGESGIRTHGRVSPTHAFQACSFNHSDISPDEWIQQVSATGALRYRCWSTGRPLPRLGRRLEHRRASPLATIA